MTQKVSQQITKLISDYRNNNQFNENELIKLLSNENSREEIMEISELDHATLILVSMKKPENEMTASFFSTDYVRILMSSLIMRLKKEIHHNCAGILSNLNFKVLFEFDRLAPLTIKNAILEKIFTGNCSENEIRLLNLSPVFLKNKFMYIYRNYTSSQLKVLVHYIRNLETFRLISREMVYSDFFSIFADNYENVLYSPLNGGDSILSSGDVNMVINQTVTPQLLSNASVEYIYDFLQKAPRGILTQVQPSVIKLMNSSKYPPKLIPVASAICAYTDMNFICLIKDETTALYQAAHIATRYTFSIGNLIDTFINSNEFTTLIQKFPSIFAGCEYHVSKSVLKTCFGNCSEIENLIDYVNFTDRIAADMASLLLKFVEFSQETLFKLAECGVFAFHTVGNALFNDLEIWKKFCIHFSGRDKYVHMGSILCCNILNSNQLETALHAVIVAASTMFLGSAYSQEKNIVFSRIRNILFVEKRIEYEESIIHSFVDAFISYHPMSDYILPLSKTIHEICQLNWLQLLHILDIQCSDPCLYVFKIKLFYYRMMKDSQQLILHAY